MMNFGIFVAFAVCATFGLVESRRGEARSNFQCPSCSEVGENAENDCETNIEMKDCKQSDPLCLLFIQYKDTARKYRRFCASKKAYDQIKKCKSCAVGMCSTTGCKAEVTELPAPVGSFMCPFCNGRGENALSNCDKEISYNTCNDANDAYNGVMVKDPVCAVFTRQTEAGFAARFCLSREDYNEKALTCKSEEGCESAMCDQPRCKAEL